MAEKSFPLENTEYTAEDAQLWFATRTTGVYAGTHLPVAASGSMNLTLGQGIAWLHYSQFAGCVYGNTDNKALTVTMSDASYDRIDRVCIRLEILNNRCYAYVKKGTAAATPAAPALQRDNVAFEISVAQVRVGVGVTAINAGNITDERLNANVCGLMSDGVTGVDTSVIQAQFIGMLETTEEQIDQKIREFGNLLATTESELDAVKDQYNAQLGELETALQAAYDTVELVNVLEANGTLLASGWQGSGVPYTQTIAVTGMLGADSPFVDLDTSGMAAGNFDALESAIVNVQRCVAGTDTLTAYCYKSKPEINIPIHIKVIR